MLDTLRSTIKGTLIYSLGNMVSKLMGFILIPLYTTRLTTAEYGILGLTDVSVQILVAVYGVSLYSAYFRWYWDKNYIKNQKSIFFTILVFIASISLVISLLLYSLKDHLSVLLFDNAGYSYIISLLLFSSCLEALCVVVLTLIRLQEKPGFYSLLNILKLLVSLVFTVYFVVVKGKKAEGIYEAQIIGNMVFFLVSATYIIKNIHIRFERKILGEMIAFSMPLLLTSITGIILTVTDRYVLKFKTDLYQVGIYNLGFRIANTLRVFIITSVQLALQPIIFRMIDSPNAKRFYSKVMTYFTYGLMFFVLFISLFGKEIVKVLSRNISYWEASNVIPVLCFAILFTMLRDVSLTGINLTKRTTVTAMVVMVVACVNIALNLLLIPVFQYMGAAFAALISQALYFGMIYFFSQKYFRIPYELNKVALMVTVGIVICILSLFINNLSLALRLIIKSAMIIAFPLVLYPFGFYERIEIERLGQFWNKWKKPGKWGEYFKKL